MRKTFSAFCAHRNAGILKEYRSDKPVTAWLCRGMHCLPPAHSREELEGLLDDG